MKMKRRRLSSKNSRCHSIEDQLHSGCAAASIVTPNTTSCKSKRRFTQQKTEHKMISIRSIFVLTCLCAHNMNFLTSVSSFVHPVQRHKTSFSTSIHFSNDNNGRIITLRKPLNRIKPSRNQDTQANVPWIPTNSNQDLLKAQAKLNLQKLHSNLERHARFINSNTSKTNRNLLGEFTNDDIDTVIESIFVAAKNDYRLIMGTADFLTLLLSVEDYNDNFDLFDKGSSATTNENCLWDDRNNILDRSYQSLIEKEYLFTDGVADAVEADYRVVMTRDALVASAFHYCDCVVARESGIYDVIDNLMRSPTSSLPIGIDDMQFELPQIEFDKGSKSIEKETFTSPPTIESMDTKTIDIEIESNFDTYDFDGKQTAVNTEQKVNFMDEEKHDFQRFMGSPRTVEIFGQGATKISQSAAKVKRAEIMAHAVVPKPSLADAASQRGLLLSVSEDWRALAIRSSASLYRLKGLVHHEMSHNKFKTLVRDGEQNSSPQIAREAREALYVYAPLAERLGMHRLKSELENAAFRILYRRQYNAAMSIYAKSGTALQSVTDFITGEIEAVLTQDPWLAPQLKRLTVASRVKKPYSMWRKLLKARKSLSSKNLTSQSHRLDNLSITSVPDAIAIRVIIKAKKMHIDEEKDITKSREEFLCYYIQNRLLEEWPELAPGRIKDYISMPKPNGYQSLHHTSNCFRYGTFWPFEVQIRSEEMHMKSEYGVAAHWDYKLTGNAQKEKTLKLPGASKTSNNLPFLLKSADDYTTRNQKDLKTIDRSSSKEVKIESLTRSSALKSYTNALSTAREHLVKNSVFVFFLTPNTEVQGKVIGVPAGSLVADALIEICEICNISVQGSFSLGNFDIFINGEPASLHDQLKNGDTLLIPSLDYRLDNYL